MQSFNSTSLKWQGALATPTIPLKKIAHSKLTEQQRISTTRPHSAAVRVYHKSTILRRLTDFSQSWPLPLKELCKS
jgi:hypothetical protein